MILYICSMTATIDNLERIVRNYSRRLEAIPDEVLLVRPGPGKWSKKEIIGHLIDSAQNNIQRFVRVKYENKPHIIYNQDAWVAAQGYQEYSGEALIQLWQLLNKHICIVLAKMPSSFYGNQVNESKEEEKLVTVQFLAEDYITHHLHHLKQIFSY